MIKPRHRHSRPHGTSSETIDPIKRDRILRLLMREYSEGKITFEQLKHRDPQSSQQIRITRFQDILSKSQS